jgi:hypothetical protein
MKAETMCCGLPAPPSPFDRAVAKCSFDPGAVTTQFFRGRAPQTPASETLMLVQEWPPVAGKPIGQLTELWLMKFKSLFFDL